MIITDTFVIGHIPKTGGHALALMLTNMGIKLKSSPFTIEQGKIVDSNSTKHYNFKTMPVDMLAGKRLFLVMRRLDEWWKSYMWHQTIHTKINKNGNLEKDTRKAYTISPAKNSNGLLLPDITCHSVFPDFLLTDFVSGYLNQITWLRMEYLQEDIKNELDIDLPDIGITHSYNPPAKYWNEVTRYILYKNNPLWAKIESNIY